MAAAILGGMQSVGGAIIGGAVIGLIEGIAANYLGGAALGNFNFGDIKDLVAFVMMILVLMVRPHGIFGREKVDRV
jgi:branched-chain amino acid transport system permease protein